MEKDYASLTGRIFDIRRFSTHDGDGIRTTIFLKGCPLKCVWCQNPEGISPKGHLIHFENKCINCDLCVKNCSNKSVIQENNKICVVQDKCTDEENKVVTDICPTGALTMDSKNYTLDEVIEIALKDKAFFKYGGGVTLSGGEPLFQKEFTIALLKRLKEAGINTAIETSLFVPSEYIIEALPYLDIIFADLKVFDDDKHKAFTGVSNELIKKNIRLILESNKKDAVIIRTPLIPQFTATNNNIHNISGYISSIYSKVRYELLNYNPLAKAKYNLLDNLDYCFEENPKMYTDEEMKEFYNAAYSAGIKNLII
ncbi:MULTISPECIES: glycyl-radical enzyme activating protein [unclassified Clostridium]|uniref:glycyl-radical enzyme activating protein n=1 Tax=unclassified Clostridium TaxID=2614128 RepID=UPI00029807E1|nr:MULTISPECIES: glycyl-radical enzyme activating protein [unclassified Clostridium]EKQ52277.1 MAG: glycyl-radical enzyme activator family protein [Clostridium sp. Maddingley MBC34-26]